MNTQIVPYSGDNRQPRTFKFGEFEITPIVDNGEDVFIASQVCAPLGLTNVSKVLSRLDDDEKREITLSDVTGRQQRIWVVTESGLYSLIGSSRKEIARTFKRWINHDMLPALRTNGFVASPSLSSLDVLKQMVNVLDEIQHKQGLMALQIEDITEELLDRDYHTVLQFCQKQHIAHTPALRQMWGKEAKAMSRERGIEIKSVDEGQYSVGRYHVNILIDVCRPKPRLNGQLSLLGGK